MSCAPILLIGFNRPDFMAAQIAAVRAARPARLYVAVDGPCEGRSDESAKCRRTPPQTGCRRSPDQNPFPKSGFSGLESAGIGRSDSFGSHFRAPRTRASVVSVVLKQQKG